MNKIEYEIQGYYSYGFECVTAADNKKEALALLQDYRTRNRVPFGSAEVKVILRIGDRVMPSDITEDSIPAYKKMRGTIVDVDARGKVKVLWDVDKSIGHKTSNEFFSYPSILRIQKEEL